MLSYVSNLSCVSNLSYAVINLNYIGDLKGWGISEGGKSIGVRGAELWEFTVQVIVVK